MFCRHCGKQLPDDSRFCTQCGREVERADEDGREAPDEAERTPAADVDERAADADEPTVHASGPAAAPRETSAEAGDGMPTEPPPSPSGATSPGAGPEATVPNYSQRPASKFPVKRIVPIALAALVLVIAAGFGISSYLEAEAERAAQAEERAAREAMLSSEHDVLIGIDASGWGTDEEGTPMPMLVSGSTAAGDAYEEIQMVDSDGVGLELVPGDYELSVEASPICEYGRMYDYPSTTFAIEIPEGLEDGEEVDLTEEVVIELDYPNDLTEERIEYARELLLDAGFDEADAWADKAYERYLEDDEDEDDAGSSSSGNVTTRSPKADETMTSDGETATTKLPDGSNARIYDGIYFEITLPVAWDARVATGGGGIKDRHTISVNNETVSETILYIDVMHGDMDAGSDITDATGTQKLGVTSDGNAIIATRGNGTITRNLMQQIVGVLDTIEIK